jgi:predicted RNase H-like nuclease (RuvC/YqgF family)
LCKRTRKRTRQLADIPLDPDASPEAKKRQKNTIAARRSRARRVERMEKLEETIEGQAETIGKLEEKNRDLGAQLSYWKARAKELGAQERGGGGDGGADYMMPTGDVPL